MISKSFYRYGLVGILSNLVVYAVFVSLIRGAMSPVQAAAICYGLGLTISYFANRRWSFESTASHRSDLLRFLLAYGVGLVATLIFISVLTLFLRPEIAQVINIGLTAVVIYVGLRVLRFGH
ncbi:GtrA family protein [Marimonas sp. MJW-29]|uniref:GtrA family protein n=1 Tax=Sulfitobacter sediminis TaxID=3234186 RepID=A0ABV3RN22_9RHOB